MLTCCVSVHRAITLGLALMVGIPAAAVGQLLPLGDGHVTDHPAVGNVFSCRTTFRAGGARHEGPWFHGARWAPDEKPHVAGRVFWPEATFTLTRQGDSNLFEGDGLPVKEPTGIFPIARTDSAYAFDTNPNHIAAQHLALTLPISPELADRPGCTPMGMIGFTVTGVALYNALDDAGRDAAAHEVQDICDGHPQANSQYHYHNASPCVPGADSNSLIGWALDGYPIFGMVDRAGKLLTNADLDACHGRKDTVMADGRTYQYAYRLTREYPYILGCFTGRVPDSMRAAIRNGLLPMRAGGRGRGRGGAER